MGYLLLVVLFSWWQWPSYSSSWPSYQKASGVYIWHQDGSYHFNLLWLGQPTEAGWFTLVWVVYWLSNSNSCQYHLTIMSGWTMYITVPWRCLIVVFASVAQQIMDVLKRMRGYLKEFWNHLWTLCVENNLKWHIRNATTYPHTNVSHPVPVRNNMTNLKILCTSKYCVSWQSPQSGLVGNVGLGFCQLQYSNPI